MTNRGLDLRRPCACFLGFFDSCFFFEPAVAFRRSWIRRLESSTAKSIQSSDELAQPACSALAVLPGAASAQAGYYLGMDLGGAMAPGMHVTGTDDDWSTKCDLIINPAEAETGDDCAVAPPPDRMGE